MTRKADDHVARVVFGNHSAVVLPRSQQARIRAFYRDVLGCRITRETEDKDDIRVGDDLYIGVLYEDDDIALDEGSFSKATYLELKADNVDDMRQRIVDFGVTVIECPIRSSREQVTIESCPATSADQSSPMWQSAASLGLDDQQATGSDLR
jgi:predicted enzyme related to lactoylglutathione lyase